VGGIGTFQNEIQKDRHTTTYCNSYGNDNKQWNLKETINIMAYLRDYKGEKTKENTVRNYY